MSEELFLGGRYFADYFYLTCSLMHFCCNSSLPEKFTNNGQTWNFKNADQVMHGERYKNCWESVKAEEMWNK